MSVTYERSENTIPGDKIIIYEIKNAPFNLRFSCFISKSGYCLSWYPKGSNNVPKVALTLAEYDGTNLIQKNPSENFITPKVEEFSKETWKEFDNLVGLGLSYMPR